MIELWTPWQCPSVSRFKVSRPKLVIGIKWTKWPTDSFESVLVSFSLELIQFDVMHGFKLVMPDILENQTDQSPETPLLKMRLSKQASLKSFEFKGLLVLRYIKLPRP